MIYKSITLIFFALIFQITGCSQQAGEGIQLSGTVSNAQAGQQINLVKLTEDGLVSIDSLQLDAAGVFEFTISDMSADFYRLEVPGSSVVNLIIDGTEDIIRLDLDLNSPDKLSVSGSFASNQMVKLDSTARKMNSDVQLLNKEALQARSTGDNATLQEITVQYYYLMGKHNENIKDIIRASYPTLTTLYGLEYLEFEQEFAFADSVISLFKKDYSNHPLAGPFIEKADGLRALAIGADAPEISLPNPEGDVVTLSSLKGKYVLIDFWAAWCRPCRMENPNVVRMYNEYKDNDFEILGVSLDRTREAWLKAIEDDGLTWKHVSDLQYFNSEAARTYQINAIPATYLIGPDGKIIGKNLRGPSLEAKLKEIFG